jgi:Sugar (and other) transporter
VTGIVALAFTIPSQIWIDRWSRRKQLTIGGLAMAACLITIGSLYVKYGVSENGKVTLRSNIAQWVIIVLIYAFVANFSWSWATVSRTMSLLPVTTFIFSKLMPLVLF